MREYNCKLEKCSHVTVIVSTNVQYIVFQIYLSDNITSTPSYSYVVQPSMLNCLQDIRNGSCETRRNWIKYQTTDYSKMIEVS
jgi:hypothetical protein